MLLTSLVQQESFAAIEDTTEHKSLTDTEHNDTST